MFSALSGCDVDGEAGHAGDAGAGAFGDFGVGCGTPEFALKEDHAAATAVGAAGAVER
jgi:hypothetical protein